MKVVINAILYHDKPRGVGVYLNNLIEQLSKVDDNNEYYVYYGSWMSEYSFTKIKSKNIKLVESKVPRNKIARNLYQLLIFPFSVLKYKPDVVHIPDTSPIIFKTTKIVSTIHDLAEYVCPEKYSAIQAFVRKIIVRTQSHVSDTIITISQYSKNHIVKNFGLSEDKVAMIYNGVNLEKFYKVNSEDALGKFNLEKEKYFLYVGEIEKTKNVSVIIEALKNSNRLDNYKVVICGKKGNDYEDVKKIITKEIEDRVIFTGYVTDDELRELYSNATAFVFPSLFEGFGLPILEALSCETPVIVSDRTSLPEVGGDSVLVFDATSEVELAKLMENILDSDLRESLISKGKERVTLFDWRKCANLTKETYEIYKGDK